jgi:hypothetical protein
MDPCHLGDILGSGQTNGQRGVHRRIVGGTKTLNEPNFTESRSALGVTALATVDALGDAGGVWDLGTTSTDRWRLSNRTGEPARDVVVTFRGAVGGRGWVERVTLNPALLAAGAATEIAILRSDTVGFVEVAWQGPRGDSRRWTWSPDAGLPRQRTAVLRLDRVTVLPLPYEYDPVLGRFRTLGFVRVGPIMVASVDHVAADTEAGRDEFLVKVLMSLAVPQRRFRRILRMTHHLG